ncbi:transporter, CPA2 family [Pseudomonas asplenii]|uniref:Transporter, CPA2 family n=1 Tax=Pseudomonas asplenii TaxID=53407 RepID=A0A1H6PGV2_9PSED|nr:transporter, CPA2 family [Pseudomonas fuscovaginae]
MMVLLFWAMMLVVFAVATRIGRQFDLVPIVSQLLLATFGLPLLMLFWIEPHWQLSGAALIAPEWLKTLYGFAFALVLGNILSDVIELKMDRESLKIALPSFCIPFVCGLACAAWVLPEQHWLNALAIGLVFAITAIPVLYLYLKHIGYPLAATRRLVQTAILIDLACWTVFGLAQGSLHLSSLLLPLAGALLPLLFYACRIRRPLAYSLSFFGLLVVAEHYKLNALIFGIGYLSCMAWLKVALVPPLKTAWMNRLQTGLAIPLILTFGIVQINVSSALNSLSLVQFICAAGDAGRQQAAGQLAGPGLGWPFIPRRQPLEGKPAAQHSWFERNRLPQPAAATTVDQPGAVLRADADGPARHPAAGVGGPASNPFE